ncbi:hypothetical protein [Actinomadura hibisca]|uniref:hypothetical protein n=1 Tax=Actinomadura hibisca TaxID=68565 RepID=UPI000836A624|nr:hypothetical protein [Actinomadura hibisca]
MGRLDDATFLETWQSRVPWGLNVLGVVLLLNQALLWWWQPFAGDAEARPVTLQEPRAAAALRGAPAKAQLGKVVKLPRYKGTPSPVLGQAVDRYARISYAELGGLWNPGKPLGADQGTYFNRTQEFVTEEHNGGRSWIAQLGSGRLPTPLQGFFTGPDRLFKTALAFEDRHTADVWPKGTVARDVASQPFRVQGRPAWIIARELNFTGLKEGVKTTTELSVTVMVDVDGYRPSFVNLCLPDTHRMLRPDVNRVISSIRVLP